MYDKKISEKELSSDGVVNWGWYKLLKNAYNNSKYENIYIITYNYDVYLERVLKAHNIPFDMVGIEEVGNKIQIIKPHGSISFCHKSINDKDTYNIKRSSVLYEAELKDFEVKYDGLDENYSVYALIPPSGDSTRMLFKWAEEMRLKEKEIISHFYVLFALSNVLCENFNCNKKNISKKLNDFYTRLRMGDKATVIDDYRISMQSRTRSKSQREKRLSALKNFCLE